MRRLRSQSALQENPNVLKAVNVNKVREKENVCITSKKKSDTSTIVDQMHINLNVKASHHKTQKSNKENLAFQNYKSVVKENKELNTFKTQSSKISCKKRVSESKANCAPIKDDIDRQASSHCRKDSEIISDKLPVKSKRKKSSPSHLENATVKKDAQNSRIEKKLHTLRPRNNNLQVEDKKSVSVVKQPSIKKTVDKNCGKTKIAKQNSNKIDKLRKTQSDSKLKLGNNHTIEEIIRNKKSVSKLCDSFNYKIDSYFVKKTVLPPTDLLKKHCPIWKKEPKLMSKRKSEYDIYDILQDEDMASETPVKVKRRRMPAKDRIKIKKVYKPKEKNVNAVKDTKKRVNDISDIDSAEIPIDLQECELEVIDDNSKTVLTSPWKQVLSNPSTEPETVVSNLLKELDESFPKTSTPQKRLFEKKLDLLGKNFGEDTSTIAEISCIPNTNSCNFVETIFQTPKVSPKRNIQQNNAIYIEKPETKCKYNFVVNLFESPPKDLKKQRKMVLDLSETKCKKLLVDEPNSCFLKPRKSYISPDLVTKHIAKTKRTNIPEKQKPASKSRQELLIEKMNKEFDDISSLELCIE
ncbi:uncharacterized protein LOC129220598 [Uloborus diversus]|uniref:uncharacterized protein LOC129220598 n=1 Tax=Uloborus diversus TaxID=327109 RepID=UPI00240A5B7E|nr:uncharacterized protein LOC129220598 [Uloborus diversus]